MPFPVGLDCPIAGRFFCPRAVYAGIFLGFVDDDEVAALRVLLMVAMAE